MSTPQFCEKEGDTTSEDNNMNESRRYAMHHNSFYNENDQRDYYPPYFYGSHWDSGMNQAVARQTHNYHPQS